MSNFTVNHDATLHWLMDLATIRAQAKRIFHLACAGQLDSFAVDLNQLPACCEYVLEVITSQYPHFEIPYHSRWRHFEVGGRDRVAELRQKVEQTQLGRVGYELVIMSVLLDAGAGAKWQYQEVGTDQNYQRSEGLALASLALYQLGHLSADASEPFRIDAKALQHLSEDTFKTVFQVSTANPLEGVDGRLQLLRTLGEVIENNPQYFGDEGRLGGFFDWVLSHAENQKITASKLFSLVLEAFQPIWPKRLIYQGVALGDVWQHSMLKVEQDGSDLIPFHKLSQWLTYSLVEPLEWHGIQVTDLDALTGLPEYRNGGVLIDCGVLRVKDANLLEHPQLPSSEGVVAWRALTVTLLDEIASSLRQQLGMSVEALPLAKILQGGTWEAGRRKARELRPLGVPPISILSDGTVF